MPYNRRKNSGSSDHKYLRTHTFAKCKWNVRKKIGEKVNGKTNVYSHDVSTISLTRLTYSLRFSLYRLAASALAGELGLGSWSNDWILVRMAATSYVGLHRF